MTTGHRLSGDEYAKGVHMRQDLMEILAQKKIELASDGFVILGVYGAFVNDRETHETDMDILFRVTDDFTERYRGFGFFRRIAFIKNELEEALLVRVDLSDSEAVVELHRDYILGGIMDV